MSTMIRPVVVEVNFSTFLVGDLKRCGARGACEICLTVLVCTKACVRTRCIRLTRYYTLSYREKAIIIII